MTLKETLLNAKICDCMFDTTANTDNGWKLSIQGKTIEDALFLFSRLSCFLFENNVPFKIATQKRVSLENREQAHKVMTIYIPNGEDRFSFAEKVYGLIIDYKGWYGVKPPTAYECYAGGIFIRNDRDEYGNYIKPQ